MKSKLTLALLFLAADTGGATGTAVAPASPKPQTDAKAKTQPEAKVHTGLLTLIKGYDDTVAKAESYYIEITELIQSEKLSRADVVATLMKARGITYESAQSQYSRMKQIWQNPEVLAKLKSGEITLKMARESTKKTQAGTADAAATPATGAGSAATSSEKETKEARYDRARKAHVAAVKECGFDLRSALMSFEADLKGAGVK